MAIPPSGSARGRLLAAAATLFYDHGIAGTGIDAIVERAGVAKKSLYNNFDSKGDLVAAYLQARHAEWLALYEARLQKCQNSKARVLAVFDAYTDHANCAYEHGFRGCGLLNAAAELPAAHSGRAVVRSHKEQVQSLLYGHLLETFQGDENRADSLARHLAFLLEGAIVRAGLEGRSDCLAHARAIAQAMMEAA
jgi:AcrR family transcriptional regulator